jgi:hypothetical protein
MEFKDEKTSNFVYVALLPTAPRLLVVAVLAFSLR